MVRKINVLLVKHSETDGLTINEIIKLKQQYWPYSYENQIVWMNNNLNKDDHHLIIKNNDNEGIIAYLNLINVKVNGVPFFGIGNVCVDKNFIGKGIGTLLINISKYYSQQFCLDMILLCKKDLIDFYKKCGFYPYNGNVYINGILFNNTAMFLNNKLDLDKSIFIDKNF